jgi:AcrR family transcriptional regulator
MKAKSMRGATTRRRILDAAAKLIQTNGVNGTSVDDVLAAAGAGKSQFYHYFASKDALVRDLVALHQETLPAAQGTAFAAVADPEGPGLAAWLDLVVADYDRGVYDAGCPIGNLASELAAQNEDLRQCLEEAIGAWTQALADALEQRQAAGLLRGGVDCRRFARVIVATVQGSLLIAKTQKSREPLMDAVAMLKEQMGQLAAPALAAAVTAPEPQPRAGAVAASEPEPVESAPPQEPACEPEAAADPVLPVEAEAAVSEAPVAVAPPAEPPKAGGAKPTTRRAPPRRLTLGFCP